VNDQMISNGHGHCLFCHCDKFTWARWTADQPA
jgi:hypothetical protein